MKVIVYWPNQMFAERTTLHRNVVSLRLSGVRDYSISDEHGTMAGSSIDSCEVLILRDDPDLDLGRPSEDEIDKAVRTLTR